MRTRSEFANHIDAHGYKRAAEIGVDTGAFSIELLEHSSLDLLVSIDIWRQAKSGFMGCEDFMLKAMSGLKKFEDRSIVIRALSLNAAKLFTDGFFDFVYLDGGHGRRTIMLDIAAWWPKIRAGGTLAGHDWTTHWNWGVPEAVTRHCEKNGLSYRLTTQDEPLTHESWWVFKP